MENYSKKPQNELWDRKWEVFEKKAKLFRYIPFVEFVLLAGSMAAGKVHEKSDFDVIIGVRSGRVFTTWFFAALTFQLFGWREKPGIDTSNRFGLSHFTTPNGYTLSPPYNVYWVDLYKKLIPVIGDEKKLTQFFDVNDWVEPTRVYTRHEKYLGNKRSWFARCWEFTLGGRLGDFIEGRLRVWLSIRLENPEKIGYKPKLVYNDDKLELYRDTRRIEEIIGRIKG